MSDEEKRGVMGEIRCRMGGICKINQKRRLLFVSSLLHCGFFALCIGGTECLAFFSRHDLQARWFGMSCGLFSSLCVLPFLLLLNIRIGKIRVFCASVFSGYIAGTLCDAAYLCAFFEKGVEIVSAAGFTVFLVSVCLFMKNRGTNAPFSLCKSGGNAKECRDIKGFRNVCRKTCRKRPRLRKISAKLRVFNGIGIFLTCFLVWEFAAPNLILHKRMPAEGIYVYANDVVYNYPFLCVFTSRIGGLSHTGICLLTRDPAGINALRRAAGLKGLRFEKLSGGYWMNDLNLDVPDLDGFTNYGSRTGLSERAYPFDVEHWRHFLQGRSANDRLRPAVRVLRLDVSKPRDAWNDVTAFCDRINTQYPEGFIYSPVPFQGRFARLYNCNTLTVLLADEILHDGKNAERLTDGILNPGGQRVEDGRTLLSDYRSENFQEEIAREREWMKKGKTGEQHWIHRFLYRRDTKK